MIQVTRFSSRCLCVGVYSQHVCWLDSKVRCRKIARMRNITIFNFKPPFYCYNKIFSAMSENFKIIRYIYKNVILSIEYSHIYVIICVIYSCIFITHSAIYIALRLFPLVVFSDLMYISANCAYVRRDARDPVRTSLTQLPRWGTANVRPVYNYIYINS